MNDNPSIAELKLRMLFNRRGRRGNIALFHAARCGSTVIGDLLGQHPDICWKGEIFNKITKDYVRPGWKRDPVKNTILWQIYSRRSRYVGFETTIMPSQQLGPDNIGLSMESYIGLLDSVGVSHFIILRRENHLKRCISAQIAAAKKMGHSRVMIDEITTVRIDLGNYPIGNRKMPLLELFGQMDLRYEKLISLVKPFRSLLLVYEKDIQEDPMIAYEKVCNFLEIESLPVKTNFQRTNPFPLHLVIENFREVQDHLTGTTYEWMLRE
jgi:hypothetical protein